jgi:transcriptional regulator with XRE-family HTH domain
MDPAPDILLGDLAGGVGGALPGQSRLPTSKVNGAEQRFKFAFHLRQAYDLCRIQSTTIVVSPQNDQGSSLIAMAKPVKKQRAKAPRKPLTEFNRRVLAAREYAKLTQEDLAKQAGCSQGTIDKLENRAADGSVYTVQIAQACNVSPYWLSAKVDHAPMLQPSGMSVDALTVGIAWSHLKGSVKDRFAKDILELALNFLPSSHPNYKHAEHMYRDITKKNKIAAELATETK